MPPQLLPALAHRSEGHPLLPLLKGEDGDGPQMRVVQNCAGNGYDVMTTIGVMTCQSLGCLFFKK